MPRNGKRIFEDRVALITGASSGIGRATALAFAAEGATVTIGDVQTEGGSETACIIEKSGGKALFVRCDVSKAADVQHLVDKTVETYGRLDYAFNNAGIEGQQAKTEDCTEENWERVLGINLKGVWLCMKHQLPHMLRQGSGAIVNCSSVAGLVGFQNIPAYVASKHGVVGITRAAALEHAKEGVRINAVCPGVIETPMIERFAAEAQARRMLLEGEPVGRLGRPEEVAGAVLWLCSETAAFVTGTAIPVDGGWVAR